MIVLLDGDELVYHSAFASQHVWYDLFIDGEFKASCKYKKLANAWQDRWDPNKKALIVPVTYVEPEERAKLNLDILIRNIFKNTRADNYEIWMSSPTNFRKEIATSLPYKGNRDNIEKPIHYNLLRKHLEDEYMAVYDYDNMEADDALAIRANMLEQYNIDDVIICSQDKDMRTVPGIHYNPVKNLTEVITKEVALYNFYTQLLTGDSSDNIPGVRGFGPKTAEKALKDCNTEYELYKRVKYIYNLDYSDKKSKFNYDKDVDGIIKENASLLYIKRTLDDEWSPPCLK